MTTVYYTNKLCYLDHKNYINRVYKKVLQGDIKQSFSLSTILFNIKKEENKTSKKRKRKSEQFIEETSTIKQMYHELFIELAKDIKLNNALELLKQKYETNFVRHYSQTLFENTIFNHFGISGGNNSDIALNCKIQDDNFLIPKKSRFFCGCVKDQCKKLLGNKFDIIIADPPWWNKYIRRLKTANNKMSYSMMYNEEIASIPVKELFSDKCLVAMWCTNAESNITALKELIFPAWVAEYITTWYWLKLTVDLEPICDFSSGSKKQPYERLILGKVGDIKHVPKELLFASVLSALHSHKPPLLDLLKPYVDMEEPMALELFARYLLPNTTSVGFEPLKWQHISLYDEIVKE